MPPRSVIALASLLALSTGHTAAGATADLSNEGYSTRVWQVEEGLPQNTVAAVLQTQDGYLWIGTYDGLARFDGEKFKVDNANNTPSLMDGQIISLYEDAQGGLWLGHDSGTVTCYREGRFEHSNASETGVGQSVVAINADSAGAVWLLHKNGVLQCVSDGRTLPPLGNGNAPEEIGMVRETTGELYVLLDGKVSRLSAGIAIPMDFGPAVRSGFVTGLGAAAGGGLWVIRDFRVRKWQDGRWVEERGGCPWGESPITSMIEMKNGCVAVSTIDQGCYLLFSDGRTCHFDQNNGLPQNWVRALYQDREDNLWLGIGTGGLVMVKVTPFSVTNPPDRWQGHTVLSVAPGRDGTLWIGTEGAGLYKFQRGAWSRYDKEQGLGNSYVWSVGEDADGRVWAGTWGGGMYVLQGERCVPAPGFDTGTEPIIALEFTPDDHGLMAGVGTGLLRWHDGMSSWAFQSPKRAATNICEVELDRSGVVWFGISGGGLGRLDRGHVSVFRKKDGLPSDRVNCVFAGEIGTLWIGTADGGLSRLKNGKFSTIGVAQGLASNVICHIADDGRGFLWLSTHNGILRFSKEELNRCADGITATVEGQMYARDDGLPTMEYSGGLKAAGCQTTDGRLWFTSSKGLVSVDPAGVRPNPIPPPVVFESLNVDGHSFENTGGSLSGLQVPPDHQRLEFQYTALSLVAPGKVKFRYRLAGLDRDWVDAGNRRSAFYSHLSPGRYRFQVIACNNDGLWNRNGAEFAFAVLPFFWQTWWFLSLAVLGASAGIGWGVRYETRRRLHRRIKLLEQERSIERERTRIAQDIHDDIGASLTRITLLSQFRPAGAPTPDGSEAAFKQIAETARAVTRALEEIVWAVAPRHDTFESLICYMANFAQDFLNAAQVRCRLDLPLSVPAWPLTAETRHNLFLAFKEALNNAVKHAKASEVSVSLKLESNAFVITVNDNGRGIDGSLDPSHAPFGICSGNGLSNLQRRLSAIGGRCEVSTQAGWGTTVSFIFSVPNAEPASSLPSVSPSQFPDNGGQPPYP